MLIGFGYFLYTSLHRIMSDVATLLMPDAKLMIFNVKLLQKFSFYAFLGVFISEC